MFVLVVVFLSALLSLLMQTDPVNASNYELWLAVSAVITVIGTSLIAKMPPNFSDLAKRLIAAAFAAVMATITIYYQGLLDTSDWGRTWLIIFMAATTIYVVLVKPIQATVRTRA
jgi:hypothetical protein